jgi:hypothetical protein
MGDIENTGKEKNEIEKGIYRILDFYNSTLIPLMEANPEKFIKRIQKEKDKEQIKKISKTQSTHTLLKEIT